MGIMHGHGENTQFLETVEMCYTWQQVMMWLFGAESLKAGRREHLVSNTYKESLSVMRKL